MKLRLNRSESFIHGPLGKKHAWKTGKTAMHQHRYNLYDKRYFNSIWLIGIKAVSDSTTYCLTAIFNYSPGSNSKESNPRILSHNWRVWKMNINKLNTLIKNKRLTKSKSLSRFSNVCFPILCYVMLCYVMLCYVMLCYVMLCYVMFCYVMLCFVMLCYAMLCYVMLCYVLLCYAMLCLVMLCYVMLCYVMLCYVMLCYVLIPLIH